MDFSLKVFTLTLVFLISGCASHKNKNESQSLSIYQQKILKEEQITNEILAKAALLSAKSLAVFVRTEQAAQQPAMTAEQIRQARFQETYIPVNMEQKVEYVWDSSPEPLMSALASNAGYQLVYMNERPPIPKTVTISSESRMIVKYFDIIEQQSVGYIDRIVKDDKSDMKMIRIYYSQF
jgi:hypothetical protein